MAKDAKSISPFETDSAFNADAQLKLETAHDVIRHPDKFAEVFVKAAKSQVQIKELIKQEIKDSLTLDPDLRNLSKGLIKEQFAEDWKAFIVSTVSKIIFIIWTLIVIGFGVWLGHVWK